MGEGGVNNPLDLDAGQLLALAGRLRGQMEAHYGMMSAAASQIRDSEKWGAKADEFTNAFRNGAKNNGYDAERDRLLGKSGNLDREGDPHSGGSTLGVSFGSRGFGGLLDVLETAAIEMPGQDGQGGKNIDDAGVAT